MNTRFIAMIGLVALAIGLVAPLDRSTALAQPPVDCRGLQTWVDQYRDIGRTYMANLAGLDTSRLDEWSPEEFAQAQAAVTQAIAEIQTLQPPPIAVDIQAQAIESLQIFQAMITAIQTDGILAALEFVEQAQTAADELDAIVLPIEERCQVGILDNDDDGIPEIGRGDVVTSAEIDPTAPLGSYANPYPVGADQATVDGWLIRVDSVIPDGTQAVLDENSFNEPPEAGRQYVIATITATYVGSGAERFDGNFRLRLRSLDNAIYTAFGDRCGVTPNEWDEDIVVPSGQSVTGNLCWSVPSDELAYVRMFDKNGLDANSVVYWSLGLESAA